MVGTVKAPPLPNDIGATPSGSGTTNGGMAQLDDAEADMIDLLQAPPTTHQALVTAINQAVMNIITQPKPVPVARAAAVSGTSNLQNPHPSGDRNVDAAAQDWDLWEARKELLKKSRFLVGGAEYEKAWHVYRDENDEDWKVLLTKTDIETNENNFFALHLLENDESSLYGLWVRWGRIGNPQAVTIFEESDLPQAKKSFEQKFKTTTNQNWSSRKRFQPIAGYYKILHLIQSETVCLPPSAAKICARLSDSSRSQMLGWRVEEFVHLVCKFETEAAKKRFSVSKCYDLKGNPFGALSLEHIKAGYRALQMIDRLCSSHTIASDNPVLHKANNDFYTAIPHSFDEPIIVKDAKAVRQKIELLEFLGDLDEAVNDLGPLQYSFDCSVDAKYLSLNCELSLMHVSCHEHQVIGDYLRNTHGPTHLFQLDVIDIFRYRKQDQIDKFVNHGNKHLLWHGSALENWAGILKQGLQLGKYQRPGFFNKVNMFGSGIYFADRSSKSGLYSLRDRRQTEAILLLCEVSLGNSVEFTEPSTLLNRQNFPAVYHSAKGLGVYCPVAPPVPVTLLGDVVVPMGATVKTNVPNRYHLRYNEYVVYDPCQVIMRYLVRAKVTHKI